MSAPSTTALVARLLAFDGDESEATDSRVPTGLTARQLARLAMACLDQAGLDAREQCAILDVLSPALGRIEASESDVSCAQCTVANCRDRDITPCPF